MIYLLCGLIIGSVIGLTGAGGALVGIPLFMQLLDMSLKEASTYSLVAVVLASLLNFITQREHTRYRSAFVIVGMSALGSYVSAPFKAALPSAVIVLLLTLVSLFSLYSVWRPVAPSSGARPIRENNLLLIGVGLGLGVLTTFTGLGGGVLLMPLFVEVIRYPPPQAVATSLLALGLSSLASLVVQANQGAHFRVDAALGQLLLSIVVAVYLLKYITARVAPEKLQRTRRLVFTVVVGVALAKIF